MRPDPLTRDWLHGLAVFDVTFMELRAGAKAPARSWDHYQAIHEKRGADLELAERWMGRGGLAYRPANGLWVFDADSPQVEDLVVSELANHRIATPTLRTPGGGRHFMGRLPANLQNSPNMKAHYHWCDEARGIKGDLKLTSRTMLVGPGTSRKDRLYQPETEWFTPAIVDPRAIFPDIPIFRETTGHLVDLREDKDKRITSAVNRIKHTRPAIRGQHAHQTLSGLTANVISFHGLDPGLGFYLLTHPRGTSWRDRCQPPLTDDELWSACEAAVDAVSPAGLWAFQQQAYRKDRDAALDKFVEIMRRSMKPGAWSFAFEVFVAFGEWSGVETTSFQFGCATNQAGFEKKLRTRQKLTCIEGVDLDLLRFNLWANAG